MRGLDLTVAEGERVLLLGASGAGKSTLLLGLAGLLDANGGGDTEGTLRVRGRPAPVARDEVGILFQDPETQLVMARAGDDVAFGLENRCVPTSAIWPRVHAALAAVGFAYPEDRRTDALSGGEKQRLALAGALALEPRVLLLDEPTANLDPDGAAEVHDVLARIASDGSGTVVLVEHRIDEFVRLVDRVVVLEAGGGIVADGPPDEIFVRERARLEALGVWLPSRGADLDRAPATPGQMLAEARDVAFRYPAAEAWAVDGIDLTVRAGEAVALVGPNGSGKSTLALMIAGLLRPLRGEARLGHDEAWRLHA